MALLAIRSNHNEWLYSGWRIKARQEAVPRLRLGKVVPAIHKRISAAGRLGVESSTNLMAAKQLYNPRDAQHLPKAMANVISGGEADSLFGMSIELENVTLLYGSNTMGSGKVEVTNFLGWGGSNVMLEVVDEEIKEVRCVPCAREGKRNPAGNGRVHGARLEQGFGPGDTKREAGLQGHPYASRGEGERHFCAALHSINCGSSECNTAWPNSCL